MKAEINQGLIRRQDLTEKEIIEVRQLAGICNALEGLDLKLELDGPPIYSAQETIRFLYYYYEGSKLVGFCSLYYEELCGMVHPEHRRKGIGKLLLAAVIKECKSRAISNILIICEEASQSGKSFVNATTNAEYDFAEHHMELEPDANWGKTAKQGSKLDFSKAGPGDVDTLAHLTVASLDRPEEETRQRLEQDLTDPTQSFYIACLDKTPIATLKAFAMGARIGIYAFGVLPEYRGRGLGKQFLTQVIRRLMAEDWTRFALEVETTNTNAIGLYKSLGFKETTTYGYYKLEVDNVEE